MKRTLAALAVLPLLTLTACGGSSDTDSTDINSLSDLSKAIGCTNYDDPGDGSDATCTIDGHDVFLNHNVDGSLTDAAAQAGSAMGYTYAVADDWIVYTDSEKLAKQLGAKFDAKAYIVP